MRQYPNPSGAYDILGTAIIFTIAPLVGKKLLIRSLVANSVSQNSQIKTAAYTATAAQTTFALPAAGVDPVSVFVFENGVFRPYDAVLADGYTITTQNTKILSIAKVISTIAEVACDAIHYLNISNVVVIRNTTESAYNTSFVVESIVSPTIFRITVPAVNPASASGNPLMYWGAPVIPDNIVFNTGRTLSNKIQIRTISHAVGGEPVTIPVSPVGLPGLPVYADSTTGIYADGAGQFGISSLGTSVVSFSNASPGVAASTIFGRTDAVRLPSGTTAQRPSAPVVGDTRNNSTFGNGEMYNGTFWAQQLPLKGFAAVVFDGTQSVGVITTLVGKNIASVTKLSTGRYTITFSGTTFGTGNYLILPNARYDSTSGSGIGVTVSPDNQAVSSSACTIQVLAGTSGVTYDADRISIVFLEF